MIAILMLLLLSLGDMIFESCGSAAIGFLCIALLPPILTQKIWEEKLNVRLSLYHLIQPLLARSFFLYSVQLLGAHHLTSIHIGSCSFHSPPWAASSGAYLLLDGTTTNHQETLSENHHTAGFDGPLCPTRRNHVLIPMRTWYRP